MTAGAGATSDALHEQGFAHFGFLTADQVAAARSIASSLDIDPTSGFYASNVHARRADATAVRDALLDALAPAVARTLPGRRAVKAVVLAKGPVGNNWVNVHQDWDYVDEREHRGAVLWCPLQDTGEVDGLLHVIPGSHRWLGNRRGSGAFPMPYERHDALLSTLGEGLETAAGEAVIYDNAALHYSPPNDGDHLRLVIGLVIVPDDAPIIHLHSPDGSTAELFAVDPAIFTSRPFGERPDGTPSETLGVGPRTIEEEDIRALVAGRR